MRALTWALTCPVHALLLTVDKSVTASLQRVGWVLYQCKYLTFLRTLLVLYSSSLIWGLFLLLLVSRELLSVAFVYVLRVGYCMFIRSSYALLHCLYTFTRRGLYTFFSFTTLFTWHVIYRPSCQRSQTGLWSFSVRCTRQFKGRDQEIDCGSQREIWAQRE